MGNQNQPISVPLYIQKHAALFNVHECITCMFSVDLIFCAVLVYRRPRPARPWRTALLTFQKRYFT
jgi:hypothetical protein